jgi:3D-(3,5/4)-trihydroxycyclohexane-1,2-dione acylhydrolase (decyclizing)
VTLSLCQDVQAEAYDYPESFFAERIWIPRRPRPDRSELEVAAKTLRAAKKPLIVAGGGVLYSQASAELAKFVEATGIPMCETQGGKSSLPDLNALNMAAVGVTGTEAANRLAAEADVVLAIGTRLQDFTTGSWALFQAKTKSIIGLNVQPFDAGKHRSLPLVADAREGLEELREALDGWQAPASWSENARKGKAAWQVEAARVTAATNMALPSDAQVIGAVQRSMGS